MVAADVSGPPSVARRRSGLGDSDISAWFGVRQRGLHDAGASGDGLARVDCWHRRSFGAMLTDRTVRTKSRRNMRCSWVQLELTPPPSLSSREFFAHHPPNAGAVRDELYGVRPRRFRPSSCRGGRHLTRVSLRVVSCYRSHEPFFLRTSGSLFEIEKVHQHDEPFVHRPQACFCGLSGGGIGQRPRPANPAGDHRNLAYVCVRERC